jgi:hypothetical protein
MFSSIYSKLCDDPISQAESSLLAILTRSAITARQTEFRHNFRLSLGSTLTEWAGRNMGPYARVAFRK